MKEYWVITWYKAERQATFDFIIKTEEAANKLLGSFENYIRDTNSVGDSVSLEKQFLDYEVDVEQQRQNAFNAILL